MDKEKIIKLDAQAEGEVIEYCVAIGDEVIEGEPLLVVESDKATMDIPASVSGTVTKWLVSIGDNVTQECELALVSLLQQGTVKDVPILEQESADKQCDAEPIVDKVVVDKSIAAGEVKSALIENDNKETKVQLATINSLPTQYSEAQGLPVGPAARKLAREMAVDLSQVVGSAHRGRVLKSDVKEYVKKQMLNAPAKVAVAASPANSIAAIPSIDFSQFGEIEKQDMSAIAKATAAHMTRCWLNIPHVTLIDEVDITELEQFRASFDPIQFGLDKKPTILPFIVMIVAKALGKFAKFNSAFDPVAEQIIYKKYINIGIAVDTPAGLLVPVIRGADKLSISEITKQINDLANKAKNRKLSIDEMTGGCFTISSLGPIGGKGFNPIINGPEVAILGVASAEIKPVWENQQFNPRNKLPLCLSFDHRVINGVDAGKFMAMIHDYIEKITKLIL